MDCFRAKELDEAADGLVEDSDMPWHAAFPGDRAQEGSGIVVNFCLATYGAFTGGRAGHNRSGEMEDRHAGGHVDEGRVEHVLRGEFEEHCEIRGGFQDEVRCATICKSIA